MENTTQQTWLDEELKNIDENSGFQGEKLPSFKPETGKVTSFKVDLSLPFGTWTGTQSGKQVTKAIIPVFHKNEKKAFWLNKKNPAYKELIQKCKKGQIDFKISATGTQADTRYSFVEED